MSRNEHYEGTDFEAILESQYDVFTNPGHALHWKDNGGGKFLTQQLWGMEIVLKADGTWYLHDTSGG